MGFLRPGSVPAVQSSPGPRPEVGRRTRRILVGLAVAVAICTTAGIAVLWPRGDVPPAVDVANAYEGVDFVDAEVVSSLSYACAGTPSDRLPDGTIPTEAECASAQVRLLSGPAAGQEVVIDVPVQVFRAGLADGEKVDVARYPPLEGGEDFYAWVDFTRDLPLGLLVGLFVVLVVGVARLRGVAALVGLALAYATIVSFMLPALRAGENPLAVALTGSISIMVVILYLAHGFSMKTTAALLGTVRGC